MSTAFAKPFSCFHFIAMNAIKSLANEKRLNNRRGVNAGDWRVNKRENYKKNSNICKYDAVQCKNTILYWVLLLLLLVFPFFLLLHVCVHVSVCVQTVCTVCMCQSVFRFAVVFFASLSGTDTNGKVAGKRHFLSSSMVNLYVFYGVYMCKLVFLTIFGVRHSVLLSFTFLTWFAFVVYHFFTCRPDFSRSPRSHLSQGKTWRPDTHTERETKS